jgi:hypothetical protein
MVIAMDVGTPEIVVRSVWIISAFAALGLTTPVSAQAVDQNTRQQIEQLAATFVATWNKQSSRA